MLYTKRIFLGVGLLLLSLLQWGCDSDDEAMDYQFVALQITEARLPVSFQLNETYDIGVTYALPNGCSGFAGFDVIAEDTTVRRVVAIGTESLDAVCTQQVVEVDTTFQFICLYSDTYLFKFYTGTDPEGEPQYLEYEVPVN